jgi:hypothetical protein
MMSFPRNYKNSIRYINENYPKHNKLWHVNWKQDNAIYIIKDIIVENNKVNVWINIWLLIKDASNLETLEACLSIVGTITHKSLIIEKWLILYNYSLYPELFPNQDDIYRNGEIFFSTDDYYNKNLSTIEQFIRISFGQYRVSVDLEYIDHITGSIIGQIKLNQTLLPSCISKVTHIRGRITFRMLEQESTSKLRILYENIAHKIANLSNDLQIVFGEILVVMDHGLETINLGQILNKRSLSGSLAYKVIKNDKY